MNCAKIQNGVVTQVIVCSSPEWASKHLGGQWVCTETLPGIGWTYEGGEFLPPPTEEEEV